jgi:molybdopterin converting factor small subunit
MFVRVKLFGTLRRLSQPETPGLWQGEIPSGSRISDLLKIINSGLSEANAAAINGQPSSFDAEIPDGAEVVLVTPMGGG